MSAPRSDPGTVGADGDVLHDPGQSLHIEGEPLAPGPRVPGAEIGHRVRPGIIPGQTSPGGDPGAVGVDRQALDPLPMSRVCEPVEVAEPPDVTPLPAAEVGRAVSQILLGQGDVVVI